MEEDWPAACMHAVSRWQGMLRRESWRWSDDRLCQGLFSTQFTRNQSNGQNQRSLAQSTPDASTCDTRSTGRVASRASRSLCMPDGPSGHDSFGTQAERNQTIIAARQDTPGLIERVSVSRSVCAFLHLEWILRSLPRFICVRSCAAYSVEISSRGRS
jgi:hypothetical protein